MPDQGRAVKAIADKAPGNAFDPRTLEALDPKTIGYKPTWHEVRYQKYGLDWDITGLHLMPENPVRGLPTMVIVHGGANNFYNFFVNPLNEPGVGQYLAQKIPVLLVSIPGNYRHGGWLEAPSEREMGYLLDGDMSSDEIKVRNAAYTFQLVMDGVVELIEEAVDGDFVLVGHSHWGRTSLYAPWFQAKRSDAWSDTGLGNGRHLASNIYAGPLGIYSNRSGLSTC